VANAPWWYPDPSPSDESPLDARGDWDRCSIGGPGYWQELPGRCKVEVERVVKLKVNDSAGTHGGRMVYNGFDFATVTIEWLVWTPKQWSDAQTLVAELERGLRSSSKDKPFSWFIASPATTARGVERITIAKIKGPSVGPIADTRIFTLECREYYDPPKSNATTTVSSSKLDPQKNALLKGNPATLPKPIASPHH
jgi:hypothetical protein